MKISSVKYLVKEGFRGAWANRLMSLASVGVLVACMVVIGLAILISENVNLAIGRLEQQNVVEVYLKDYAWAYLYGDKFETEQEKDANGVAEEHYLIHNDEEALAVRNKILGFDNVADAKYISSEEGLAEATFNMSDEDKEYFSFLEEENPISASIEVTMKDMGSFDQTVEQLESMDEVFNVQSYEGLADTINSIKQGIYVAGVWIIAILIVIALVVVSNTIRVTMYNRKLEISIMKAVGATNAFVRIPFVIEGVLIGIVSALISEGLLYFCYRVATETIATTLQTTEIVKYGEVAIYLLLVFVAIGILAGMLGSFIIIGKYLKREGSEFTAI